jgi:hypothetical protein
LILPGALVIGGALWLALALKTILRSRAVRVQKGELSAPSAAA